MLASNTRIHTYSPCREDVTKVANAARTVTKTAMTLTNFSDNSISESMTSTTPWGEWGRVEDVAMGAVFLASSDAAFVTGVGLDVDGGYLAQ